MKNLKYYKNSSDYLNEKDNNLKHSVVYINDSENKIIGYKSKQSNKYVFTNSNGKPVSEKLVPLTESLWWKVDGTTLYVSGKQKEGYEERELHVKSSDMLNGWHNLDNKSEITKCVIEDGLYPISLTRLFDRLTSLDTFDGIENIETDECKSIRTLFQSCSKLTNFDFIKNWNTSNCEDMGYAFYGCSEMESIDVLNFNISKVKNIKSMFNKCSNLKSIDVSNWDVRKVNDMSYAFYMCSKLETIDVSNWDTSNCSNMRCLFGNCSNLKSIDISNWDVSKVNDMSFMFNYVYCDIDISNWDMSSIKDNDATVAMFQYAKGLKDMIIPKSLKYISSFMYNHCTGFEKESVYIHEDVKWIGYTHQFYDAYDYGKRTTQTNFKKFIVDSKNPYFFNDNYGVLYEGTPDNPRRIISIPPFAEVDNETYEILEGVTIFNELMLNRNQTIKKLKLPNSFVIDYSEDSMTKYDSHCNNAGIKADNDYDTQTNLCASLYHWTTLKEFIVNDDNPNYSTINGILYSKDKTSIVKVADSYEGDINIPNTCKTIKQSCFGNWFADYGFSNYINYEHVKIKTITIPESIINIEERQINVLNYMLDKKFNNNICINSEFDIVIDDNNPKYAITVDSNGKKTIVEK